MPSPHQPADPLASATGAQLLDELMTRGELDDDADGVTLQVRIAALRNELDVYTLQSRREDYSHD
jgi:hypothetical protein